MHFTVSDASPHSPHGRRLVLASCLIYAKPLPAHRLAAAQTTTPSLAAQGHELTDDWSLPSAHFVDS